MSTLSEWRKCLAMSRGEFRASGGCLWRIPPKSPGGHIRIPSGTQFKVRLSGPQRKDYANGMCQRGRWYLASGGEFLSANQAVASARPQVKASNAFLYVEFQVGDQWMLADELRQTFELSIARDEIEDIALAEARQLIRNRASQKRVVLSPEEIDQRAEALLDTNATIWELAREAAVSRNVDLDLDLGV